MVTPEQNKMMEKYENNNIFLTEMVKGAQTHVLTNVDQPDASTMLYQIRDALSKLDPPFDYVVGETLFNLIIELPEFVNKIKVEGNMCTVIHGITLGDKYIPVDTEFLKAPLETNTMLRIPHKFASMKETNPRLYNDYLWDPFTNVNNNKPNIT